MGVITKLDNSYGSFLCILGSFLKVKEQNGGYFWGLLKFQIFFGVLEILDIFWGCTVDAGPEPTYDEKNESTPPPPGCVMFFTCYTIINSVTLIILKVHAVSFV